MPTPPFVKIAIDAWTAAAGLSKGPLFRRVRRRKYPEKPPAALSERMIWHIVTKYARQTGLVNKLALIRALSSYGQDTKLHMSSIEARRGVRGNRIGDLTL